jgi:predicted alpha/beta-fold hydrolase
MPTMTRLIGSTALAFVLSICATGNTDAGDVPDTPPPEDWVKIRAPASTDIIQFIQALPHDPHLLGPVAAHVRMKAYGPGFSAARVSSLDGTPLAGRIGGPALKPRPGVVLVHGFRQTKDRKFVVELAELLARNGWRVLAIDLRGTARAVISLPLRSRAGGRRPRTSSQRRGT